jgi:uncharacterized membrane protein YphA (DoxX/SURF4 family)
VQRLFSTFPNSWPGRGLLLQRVGTAAGLFCLAVKRVSETSHLTFALPQMIAVGAGLLLLIGLWTPVCGMLIAAMEVWVAISSAGPVGFPIMLAVLGASLAMIGPGAWSIDALLFGRKRFEISKR